MTDPEEGEMRLISPEDVAWQRVAFIQVKRYDVSRRIGLEGGPVQSLPLLGTKRHFAVEVIHKDDTWDRICWLDRSVEAHRVANELAAAHGLILQVAS